MSQVFFNEMGIPESDLRWSSLISTARKTAAKFTLLYKAQVQFNTALKYTSIPKIWLKSIALARTVYPQPCLRPMRDLYVLVPFDQRKLALHFTYITGFPFSVVRENSSVDY